MGEDSINEVPVEDSTGVTFQKTNESVDDKQMSDNPVNKGTYHEMLEVLAQKDPGALEEDVITNSDDDRPPEVGMKFRSREDLCNYYRRYAQRTGFGITIRRSSFTKEGICREAKIQCCKSGTGGSKPTYRFRLTAKTNCPAMIVAKLLHDGLLHLVVVRLDHNHPVNPSMSKFFRCNKKLPNAAKKQVECIDEAETRPNKVIGSASRLKLGEGDVEAICRFFARMQSKNTNFFYAMDLDDEGRLRNVFWADAKARAAYQYFDDVVSFDTTYLESKYDMPFAPFLGVNHHGHFVLLGCSLLSEETRESYTWLFETWLACMSGHPPSAIITDQCKAVQDAVAEVFPRAHHRFCLCQILKRIPKELGGHAEFKRIKKEIKKLVFDSLRIDEFEEKWGKMIREYGIEGNGWLQTLYKDRHSWAPVFVKEAFWAGMSITQRGEHLNSFFDGCIHPKTSIKQFISRYEKVLQSKYEKEEQADFESFLKSRHLLSKFYMEKQLSELYTIDMFKRFQDELQAMMYCHVSLIKEDGPVSTFDVIESIFSKDGKKLEDKGYEVLYNADLLDVRCICCLFQFRGIMCKHALTVLKLKQVYEIPSQYILNRWRKGFKRLHVVTRQVNDAVPDNVMDRYDHLSTRCIQLVEVGMMAEDKFELALKLIREVEKFLLNDSVRGDARPKIIYETTMNEMNRDPLASQSNNSEGSNIFDPLQMVQGVQKPQKRKNSVTVDKHKKKAARKTSDTVTQSNVLQSALSVPAFGTDVRKQTSTNQMEKANAPAMPLGGYYDLQMNSHYFYGSQSGMRNSGFLPMPQFDQQMISNQTRMQWPYQNMPKDTQKQ
uniref:Protein FAR1-RELATED SEQUENCE n=1 Tax=Anthurium amnicola TaxID=1678845 RepID=A0A1D1YF28_9ARAE